MAIMLEASTCCDSTVPQEVQWEKNTTKDAWSLEAYYDKEVSWLYKLKMLHLV